MNLFGVLVCTLFVTEGSNAARHFLGQCPQIVIRYGRVKYRQRGKIARFLCNTGYMLAGDRYSVCVQGQWDNSFPKCVRATCQNAKPPANGLIYPSHRGAVLNFYCKSNYQLRGPNITYCNGLHWDNPLPACLPTNSTPSLSCDFEHEDVCGWNHDLNHDFDWKRLNYATPSGAIGTGPSHDHTKGVGKDGYYMYIESSARNVADVARLISPVYDKTPNNTCFEFYYHMYGVTTGSLRVYLKKVNETWKLQPQHALFTKEGNQGNKWYRGFIVLGPIDDDYQIVIEGVRGSSYVSDIAIDDVKVIKNCVPENEVEEVETTTEDSSSEPPISVESCENRCNTNDTQSLEWVITCDCDEGCYERNRCCPDYFDFCVLSTLSDDFGEDTTEMSSTMMETTELILTTTLAPIPSYAPREKVTPQAIPPSKTWKPTTPKLIPKLTQKPTIKTVVTTTTTVTPLLSAKPEEKEESKIVYVTPDDSNDVEEVPVIDPVEAETPDEPVKEIEVVNDYESDKSFDHQKVIIPAKMGENKTKTIVFAVGVVFGVLFGVSGMAFVAKRYQLCRCNKMRLNQSSNGDSQSDVRFLTSDEVLDFNLATDYDTL